MTVVETPTPSTAELGSARGRVWGQLRRNKLGIAGAVMLLVVVAAGALAPVIAPYGPTEVHFDTPFQLPGTVGFLLGTDDLGRDILSRTAYGIRVSLVVGVLSVLLAVVVGTPLGLVAGYWRWLDAIVSRLTDVMLAFPFLIIAVALAAISGPSLGNAVVALGIAQIPTMIRVVRGETMRIRSTDFVLSARTMDATGLRVIFQHVLPNCVSAIIVQATVIMPVAVIGEALLSFLGLGIQPPTASLGIMLSDAQQYLARAPYAAVVPGVAIAVICLGFNLFGDALRDALDPTSSERNRP
ncbi:peptide/nickel transport system permease protein [Frigoribacterium sp. PhB160]|uniref:ABC transporter permease n=1 Tax=Frigoribacterium sp. PhB160 TaxID=2485192 RepID=UPI000F490684|nr:ABC transporter permease [Frigoribacterium sp. PhB160]ROS59430.1 peptide/nickel transport system permease protein [Frigoribacterium sp. PhB160]